MNRLIPIMLLSDRGIYKSFKYKSKKYLGDPFNILRILNQKGVDEAAILNIDGKAGFVDYGFLQELASEAFFPLSYGGNINNEEMAISLVKHGFEKIIFNSAFYNSPNMIKNTISTLGSQAVSINIDYKRNFLGKISFYKNCGRDKVKTSMEAVLKDLYDLSPGEIILSCMDKDGTRQGYDLSMLDLCHKVSSQLVLNCGAKDHNYLTNKLSKYNNISFAGSSTFFLSANNNGVLITYPERIYEM